MSEDILTRLRAVLHNDRSVELMNREAADEIERLRAERDDARREVCDWCGIFTKETPQVVALKNKWDCFKEKP